jgi:AcrR family transcriptional regulator
MPARSVTKKTSGNGSDAVATRAAEAELFGEAEHPTSTRVLLAALEALAELGYHGTATRDLSKRAGMSAGGLYTHYESKQALLEHIIHVTHQGMLERMLQAEQEGGTPTECLARVVRVNVAFHARYNTACRVANYELRSLTPENLEKMRQLRREMGDIWRRILTAGVESGEFTIDDVHVATMFVASLGIDVSRWFKHGGVLTPDELAAHYEELVLAAFTAPRTSPGPS